MTGSLQTALTRLRLSGLAASLDVRLQEAAGHHLSHGEFLELVLQDELLVLSQAIVGTVILITHRLQDAFTMATHVFNKETNHMEALPAGQADRDTSFMVLHEGRLVFDGSTHDLVHSDDPFLKQYLA